MAAPAIPQEISLTLFGGMDTSLSQTTLPEGLSPACNDVVFFPGGVGSRPCLSKIFAAAFLGNPPPSVRWFKKYLQANGLPLNLYLDSNALLSTEDPVNAPGVRNTLQQISPAAKTAKSVTFDGVEYIAFSDGVHPVDIPRFYDTYLEIFDRISKDGVGTLTGTTIADIVTQINISAMVFQDLAAISTITEAVGGTTVTVTTTTPHGLTEAGGFVLIHGVVTSTNFNGLYQILTIPSATTFTVQNAGMSIANDNTGNVALGTVKITTASAHGLNVGDFVSIAGNGGTLNSGQSGTSFGAPNPLVWQVVEVIDSTHFLFALTGPTGSLNQQIPAVGAGGNIQVGGMISAGTHQMAVSFLWRGGFITKPSPPIQWTCSGFKQAQVSNLPIGPTGVIARILHFTGAGGDNFFNIPTNAQLPGNSLLFNGGLAPPTIVNALVVPDNTTVNFIVDFPDNTLFAADGSDVPGNNLFALETLGPCLGFDAYASRVIAWGRINKLQRFQNMGFEGGTGLAGANAPLGWTIGDAPHFALVNGANGFGLAGKITGTGAPAAGIISQSAYQDENFLPIVNPDGEQDQYSFFVLAVCSAAGLNGNLVAKLSSASTAFTATATIPINTISSTTPTFVSAVFSQIMPATIPSDMTFSIYADNLNNGATVTYDENMVVFTNQPYRDDELIGTYINNPESFDGETGVFGSTQDPTQVRDTFQALRQTLTILTAKCRHTTQDNGDEPGTWSVDQVEQGVGAPSIHSATTGPGWGAWISDTGKALALRITQGGDSYKISREMKTEFKAANMNAKQFSWLCNVDDESQAGAGMMFMGIPQGAGTLPSKMLVLDYFESDTASDIAANRPLHIGFTGKMLTTDLGRKWTNWNIPMAYGAVLARSAAIDQFCVGSGPNTAGNSFGNVYTFSAAKFTDDDYGAMLPVYTTYFFVNHDMETQMQLGGKLKLFGGDPKFPLAAFITGVGILQITPLLNTIANRVVPAEALHPWALTQTQADDIELKIQVTARRCAFEVAVQPQAGQTDVSFLLTHLTVPVMANPVAKVGGVNRGSA